MGMAVPVIVAIVVGYMFDAAVVRWTIIAIGFAITAFMHIALVPLIRR